MHTLITSLHAGINLVTYHLCLTVMLGETWLKAGSDLLVASDITMSINGCNYNLGELHCKHH